MVSESKIHSGSCTSSVYRKLALEIADLSPHTGIQKQTLKFTSFANFCSGSVLGSRFRL